MVSSGLGATYQEEGEEGCTVLAGVQGTAWWGGWEAPTQQGGAVRSQVSHGTLPADAPTGLTGRWCLWWWR